MEKLIENIIKNHREKEFENLVLIGEIYAGKILDYDEGYKVIHFVSKYGTPKMLEILLENAHNHKKITNLTDNYLRTPIHYASLGGKTENIKILLEHGANIELKDVKGKNSFIFAILGQNLQTIKFLSEFKNKIKLDEPDEEGKNALDYAINMKNMDIVKYLIEELKMKPNKLPVKVEDEALYNYLKEKGMETELIKKDKKHQKKEPSKSPLEIILEFYEDKNYENLKKYLLEEAKSMDDEDKYLFIDDILSSIIWEEIPYEDKLEIVRTIIQHLKFDIDTTYFGETLLHKFTNTDDEEIAYKVVKILLQIGANPNVKDKDGDTPLHLAAYNGLLGVTKLLVKYGANINEENNIGYTPLALSIKHKRRHLEEYFKRLKAKI